MQRLPGRSGGRAPCARSRRPQSSVTGFAVASRAQGGSAHARACTTGAAILDGTAQCSWSGEGLGRMPVVAMGRRAARSVEPREIESAARHQGRRDSDLRRLRISAVAIVPARDHGASSIQASVAVGPGLDSAAARKPGPGDGHERANLTHVEVHNGKLLLSSEHCNCKMAGDAPSWKLQLFANALNRSRVHSRADAPALGKKSLRRKP